MLKIAPPRRRSRGPMIDRKPPAVASLTLVSASLDTSGQAKLTLSFDRAINVESIDPAQIGVLDGAHSGNAYSGDSLEDTPTPQSVVVRMSYDGPAPAGTSSLNASNATGIVSQSNPADAWAGVTALTLPFG